MKPYVVLGRYVPSVWNSKVIGRELTALTAAAGYKPHSDPAHGPIHWKRGWYSEEKHAEVRRITLPAPSAGDWHYDGDTTEGSKPACQIVTWANRAPTEILYEGTVYQPLPFEVVVFANMKVRHRRPANAPERRWMFRQR